MRKQAGASQLLAHLTVVPRGGRCWSNNNRVEISSPLSVCLPSSTVRSLSYPPLAAERPLVEHKRVEINSSVPEDPEMAAIVRKYQDLIGERSCGVSCCTRRSCACPDFVALDGIAQRRSHGA